MAIVVVSIIFLASIIGWWMMDKGNNQPKKVTLGSLVYGWDAWPGVLPMLIASDQGYFAKYGLTVHLKEEPSNEAKLTDLASRKIDFASNIVTNDVIRKVAEGQAWQIVAIADASAGADGIVSRQDIVSTKDLRGKRVAVEKGTFEELLLFAALEREGLTLKDVTGVDLNAQDAAAAFLRQEVDAAVTYEPHFSRAITGGNGRRLFTTADVPNLISDTIVFPQTIIDSAPEKINAVLRAYFDGATFIKKHPTEAHAIGEKYFHLPAAEVAAHLQGLHILDLSDNVQAMSNFSGRLSLSANITQAERYQRQASLIIKDIYPGTIITPNFIWSMVDGSGTSTTTGP